MSAKYQYKTDQFNNTGGRFNNTCHQFAGRGIIFFLLSLTMMTGACRKMIVIGEPINTITATEVFQADAQAGSAMAGVYTLMINVDGSTNFAAGETSALTGMSSDELTYYVKEAGYNPYVTNTLTATTSYGSGNIWSSAYTTIYRANSVIEGISASKSAMLHDSARTLLTGEAKFVRAFSYFYLTNLFGDVPLALTIDFNQTQNIAKTPQKLVYQQIVKDLTDAQAALPAAYVNGVNTRIRPNKWAATALLARVYLYMGDYANAASQATAVINQSDQYSLPTDLNTVFLTNSQEAIWQLQQNPGSQYTGTATPEGMLFVVSIPGTGNAAYNLSDELLGAFETGDARKAAWVGMTDNTYSGQPPRYSWYPYKYKTGNYNRVISASALPTEYYMVLRLAEQYLIRAEAAANGAAGGTAAAIADLNVIRSRAGLPALPASLSSDQVKAAVAQERRIEFFAEWGHRWLDLKRTGQAQNVLSQVPVKQPWRGDYQLLYPIPIAEIQTDHNLLQNIGY